MMKNGIREFRERLGLTKAELARRTGISRQQLGRLEDGKRKLSPEWAERIAPALGCAPSKLMFPDDIVSVSDVAPKERLTGSPMTYGIGRFSEGPHLSAQRIADFLGFGLDRLENLTGTSFTSARLPLEIDEALDPSVRILVTVIDMSGEDGAAAWFKHQPIPGWVGKTAHDLVREGKSDKVLAYLEAVRSGVYA